MTLPPGTLFLRWIWPKLSRCPKCQCTAWAETGRKSQLQFRRCSLCDHAYTAMPVAREIDEGGAVSVVEPL